MQETGKEDKKYIVSEKMWLLSRPAARERLEGWTMAPEIFRPPMLGEGELVYKKKTLEEGAGRRGRGRRLLKEKGAARRRGRR